MQLKVENLAYDYVSKAGITPALKSVNASFESGKIYAIVGRSGSGKTTLLSLLAGFDKPKSGKIYIDGTDISKKGLSKYRKQNVSVIFQSYNLIPFLTALENVLVSLEGKKHKMKKSEKKKVAVSCCKSIGIGDEKLKKYPKTLSGGEQQRIAIARAIVQDTSIILADEPTGNLDNENSQKVISILKDLAHKSGKCVIVVTHSSEISSECDEIIKVNDGII